MRIHIGSVVVLLSLAVSAYSHQHHRASGRSTRHVSLPGVKAQVEQERRLISVSEDTSPTWKTEDELMALKRKHIAFVDVTEVYDVWRKIPSRQSQTAQHLGGQKNVESKNITYPKPRFSKQLAPILSKLSLSEMQSNLGSLTAFHNRYFMSKTGVDASHWIRDKAQEIIDVFARSDDTSVSLFNHTWEQPSVIARIAGSDPFGPLTILGCHLDSLNLDSPLDGRAPGADDNGSGVVNLLEALRVLLLSDFRPATPVEFHWYAAEEVGLRGSAKIATDYQVQGKDVQAFMQIDMTAYLRPGSQEVIALVPDYVDEDLTEYVKSLVIEYNRIPWAMEQPCEYGCSDHFSWDRVGFPTVYPFEAITGDYSPHMHTDKDTTSAVGFSWEHSLEFVKLAVAFIYELAADSGWNTPIPGNGTTRNVTAEAVHEDGGSVGNTTELGVDIVITAT